MTKSPKQKSKKKPVTAPAKKPVGRPSAFDPKYIGQVKRLCMLGLKDVEMAEFFGVAESTFHKWKIDFPEFSEAIKEGKIEPDLMVTESLFKKATGFTVKALHFTAYEGHVTETEYDKYYPPETLAQIFWLRNRRKDLWRNDPEKSGQSGTSSEDIMAAIADSLPG